MPTRDQVRVPDHCPGGDPTVDPGGAPTPSSDHPNDPLAGNAVRCAAQPPSSSVRPQGGS
jgi:hypothetical protein